MIFLVDDDPMALEVTGDALRLSGYEVKTFDEARELLAAARRERPDLIISDVMMPEMNGFDLRNEYERNFGYRLTPFIFLSSLGESGDVVRGLGEGADDYLIKPVAPAVLAAKAASVMANKARYASPSFVGDLSAFSFQRLVEYLEKVGLTGEVLVGHGDEETTVHFFGGLMLPEDEAEASSLFEYSAGTFSIYSRPVDFSELEGAAAPARRPATPKTVHKPESQGSVRFDGDFREIESELAGIASAPPITAPAEPPKEEAVKTPETKGFDELFESGFDAYRGGDFTKALEIWQAAFALYPDNKILETNLAMLKKKMGAGS